MPKKKKVRLPDKPSELILLALKDLARVEKNSKKYYIDMGAWHEYVGDSKKCAVCLAGSIMAKTLNAKLSADGHSRPDDFDTDTCNKLLALDNFRRGEIDEGLARLFGFNHVVSGIHHVPAEYCFDKDRFKKDMKSLAIDLARRGF